VEGNSRVWLELSQTSPRELRKTTEYSVSRSNSEPGIPNYKPQFYPLHHVGYLVHTTWHKFVKISCFKNNVTRTENTTLTLKVCLIKTYEFCPKSISFLRWLFNDDYTASEPNTVAARSKARSVFVRRGFESHSRHGCLFALILHLCYSVCR
jgi:hypothetical protein